jgi:hypothetical protein
MIILIGKFDLNHIKFLEIVLQLNHTKTVGYIESKEITCYGK